MRALTFRTLGAFAALMLLTLLTAWAGVQTDRAFAQNAAPSLADYGALGASPPQAQNDSGPSLDDYARAADQMSTMRQTEQSYLTIRARFMALISRIPAAWGEMKVTLERAAPSGDPIYFLRILIITLMLLVACHFLVRQIYGKRIVGPWFIGLQRPEPQGIVEKLPVLLARVMLGVVGIGLNVIAALIIGTLLFGRLEEADWAGRVTVIIVYITYVLCRVVAITWRMILAPYLSNYRLPCFTDSEARRLFNWLWSGAVLGIVSVAICVWFQELGLPDDIHALLYSGLTLLTVGVNIALVLVNKRSITNAITGECHDQRAPVLTRLAGQFWAPAACLYFVLAWLEMSYRLLMEKPLGFPLIAGAYLVLLTLLVVYGLVSYIIARLFHRKTQLERFRNEAKAAEAREREQIDDAASAEPEEIEAAMPYAHTMRSFEDLAARVSSILAIVAGVYALLWIWGLTERVQNLGWFESLFDIGLIVFMGYIAYHSTRIWIDHRIEEEGGDKPPSEPGDEGGGKSAASRLATLLPLFRNFMLFTIALVTVLSMLYETGVNVAPLFAGAGVVGLAIGFGAQTLIRDIFSGIFFLVDDAFRKGEYIDIGEVKGTVEKISVRSFQLRHHLGALHTIPFGEVQYLTNYSRDWVMMKLPLRLTYDTDVDRVRKLIKKLGQELLTHPTEGEKFLQPLKSQGVYRMEDSAMIIRVKFMTRPGDQWTTRKLVYQRIREIFEKEGVKFAHREVTVRLAGGGDPENLSKAQRDAIGGAVRPVIDEELMEIDANHVDDR